MSDIDFRADLHCHSYFSDGSNSPEELVDLAIEKKLSGLSVTDHDTLDAYPRLLPYAAEKNLSLLPGIELSSCHKGETVHILSYGFQLENEVLNHFIKQQKDLREKRNLKILQNLKRLGFNLDDEVSQLQKRSVFGRPHIAELMVKKGFVNDTLQAFSKFLGEGKPAYEMGVRIEASIVIETIKKAKGLAILAHPHLITKKRVLKALIEMPFDGIEVYYAKMGPVQNAPFLKIAKEKGWIMTGGSDYHGTFKSYNMLGSSWVDQETFQKLYDTFKTPL